MKPLSMYCKYAGKPETNLHTHHSGPRSTYIKKLFTAKSQHLTVIRTMSSAPSRLESITDPTSHDVATSHAWNGTLVVLYVTSESNPICVRTTPKVESLAADEKYQAVRFFKMELTPQTAPMIKFGIQNTPIFILLRGKWCETILGADMRRVEQLLDRQLAG